MGGLILGLACLVAFGLAVYFGRRTMQARGAALANLAAQLRLAYTPLDTAGRYTDHTFEFFQRGSSRRASNVLAGTWEGLSVAAFDYRYYTGSGRYAHAHEWTVLLVGLPAEAPYVSIEPRRLHLTSTAALAPAMPTGVAAFDPRYEVRSPDHAFARRVLEGPLVDYLARGDGATVIEMYGSHLALRAATRYAPAQYPALLQLAKFVHARIAHALATSAPGG